MPKLICPIGTSFVTQVAPPELVSLSMGYWFLSSAGGNFLAGWLGSLYCVIVMALSSYVPI